jgi:UDP-N-acetylmuramoylalanine--D-glutamate ligase
VIPVTEFAGKQVAVLGLGRSGIAAARALTLGGARVSAWDDTEAARQKAEAAGVPTDDLNKRDWQNFAALVLAPGIPLHFGSPPNRFVQMARRVGVPIIGDIELFARTVNAIEPALRPRIIGITGTNGKSTTTALIGHILTQAGREARVGGNIGISVLDLPPPQSNAIYVLELSSYQLDLAESLRLDAAVLLNFSPDHLDRHGGMEGYINAKCRVFRNQHTEDHAIVGMDDAWSRGVYLRLRNRSGRRLCPISAGSASGSGVCVIDGKLYDGTAGRSVKTVDLTRAATLPGEHNWQNAAAAYAACRAMGLEAGDIADGLMTFPGLAHRLETVGRIGRVRFVNDSKATNADATQQALKAFARVHLIAGGRAKAGGIEPLAPLFPRVAQAYLIGEAMESFAQTLSGKVALTRSRTLEAAVEAAYADAMVSPDPNPVVLLSPAAASQDQFRDFEHRGDVFREIVARIAAREGVTQDSIRESVA